MMSDNTGGLYYGSALVIFLESNGTVNSVNKIGMSTGGFTIVFDSNPNWADTTGIGDINEDGIGDVGIGYSLEDTAGNNAGCVHIVFLDADGSVKSHHKITDGYGGLTAELDSPANFGQSVQPAWDVNGDLTPDMLVGASGMDTSSGALYLLFLNTSGLVVSHFKISRISGDFTAGILDGDMFGNSCSLCGDLNGMYAS